MTLAYDWKIILKKAWSVRLMVLAGLLSAAEVVVPLVAYDLPPRIFAALSGLTVCAALIARIVAQRNVP